MDRDHSPFYRDPLKDSDEVREQCLNVDSDAHRFFRLSGPRMQHRFADIVDHSVIPRLLIHGNPHLANYCKTQRGAAMVDFDRSRIGPYAYDLVRFLISVSLCRLESDENLLHPIILDHFRRGYVFGLSHRDQAFEEMQWLRNQKPKNWQKDTRSYLDSGKKWARRLDEYGVRFRKRHRHMLEDYLKNRNEMELLDSHKISRIAEVPGSMGKLHYLFLLEKTKGKDNPILIDIKEVYDEQDTEWYTNPFLHHGIRMNEAGKLYAPNWELRPGHATWKGQQFWGRQIPTQQVKPSNPLTELEQCDLCFSVATQLGSGHGRGVDKPTRKLIQQDFENRFSTYVGAAEQMRHELLAALAQYRREATFGAEQTEQRLANWS